MDKLIHTNSETQYGLSTIVMCGVVCASNENQAGFCLIFMEEARIVPVIVILSSFGRLWWNPE